jgi:alpha-beta hydrolase superfamily lysophospholipase
MKCLVPIPQDTADELKREKQTGLGYHFVSIELKDGRHFEQAVLSEGCVIAVHGYTEIPFRYHDIATVKLSGKPWNFRANICRLKAMAASA